MLSRFFNNSKPIVLTSLLLISSAWFWGFSLWNPFQEATSKVSNLLVSWLMFLLIIFLVDFITKKSKINKQNSFALASFVALSLSTPEVFFKQNLLLASLFFILAIRRIINLQNPVNTKKKIFEASIWLFYASLYEPWLSLGYLVLYFSIIYFVANDYRNFAIPFVGIIAAYVLKQLYFVLRFDEWFLFPSDFFVPSWELTNWLQKPQLYLVIAYLIIGLWAGTHAGRIFKKAKIAQKTNLSVLLILSIIGLINASLSPHLIAEELILCFIPFCFLLGAYFQLKQKKIYKEISFGLLLSLPFIKLVLLVFS